MMLEAIKSLVPRAKFTMVDDLYSSINWLDERPQPTEEEIIAKIAELQAAEPMRMFREKRDRLLRETDAPWGLADYTHPNKQAWLDYRQALRDITSTQTPSLDENGDLDNIVWPVKPE